MLTSLSKVPKEENHDDQEQEDEVLEVCERSLSFTQVSEVELWRKDPS